MLQRNLLPGDGATVWIDVDPSDPGPDFKATWIAKSDNLGLRKIESFSDNGTWVDCPALRVRSDAFRDDFSNVVIPRGCLDKPDAVRVSVRTERQTAHGLAKDWAPAPLHFYAWVARG